MGDSTVPSGLYARLCHAFLVFVMLPCTLFLTLVYYTNKYFFYILNGWVLHHSLLHSVIEYGKFINKKISQGSVTTWLRYGGMFNNDRIENLPVVYQWKEILQQALLWPHNALVSIEKLAIDEWPWHAPKVITVAAIKWSYGVSHPVCGLLFQRQYLGPFSRHCHFWSKLDCLWSWELLHFWQRSLNYEPRKHNRG